MNRMRVIYNEMRPSIFAKFQYCSIIASRPFIYGHTYTYTYTSRTFSFFYSSTQVKTIVNRFYYRLLRSTVINFADRNKMALPESKLEEILHLLPEEIHGETKHIFAKIPGSLLKFLNPAQIKKKVECRENDLPVDSSKPMESADGRQRRGRDQPGSVSLDAQYSDSSKSNYNNQTPVPYGNKYVDALHRHLLGSIKKAFRGENITEVSPDSVADDIVRNCLAECPDWGQRRSQTPSVIVRFDSNYINEREPIPFNINTYVYAYLACEHQESRFSLLRGTPPKICFEVTIELNGIAISSDKIARFCKLLTDLSLEEVIKTIETTNKVTWDNLDQDHSNVSAGQHAALLWDDI